MSYYLQLLPIIRNPALRALKLALQAVFSYCSDASLTLRCQAMRHSVNYCVITMAKSTTSNISIRMDSDLKAAAEALYEELSMNLSTAFNIFIRQSL